MHDDERITTKDVFLLIGCSALIGALLVAFVMYQPIVRVIFSLGALFVGIRFFRRYERLAMRVWLVILSTVFFVIYTFLVVVYLYSTGMYAPPA
ncbi:MAG: hypothetical protein A9Z00_13500 [Thermobacillus sp. ZCTH02-B1]|uniref:hypothetical protein n=1 Tax=Thermobacillus sp. ZCTH02-B1 TaxID=1858795 RepID=UPI000B54BFBC|nr:hypothetical protein [Thermobacillus sp. ZCTH02-B1]OUM96430.1 MAG: hypothetical protein A9Z00_13500 [Thermobacillus sp. ZCTH02-B1]